MSRLMPLCRSCGKPRGFRWWHRRRICGPSRLGLTPDNAARILTEISLPVDDVHALLHWLEFRYRLHEQDAKITTDPHARRADQADAMLCAEARRRLQLLLERPR